MSERVWVIYLEGKYHPKKCKQLFNELLEADKTGEYLYLAGRYWGELDYQKALDRLLEVDQTGKWLYRVGYDWPWFDYERTFSRLLEVDKEGQWICKAGIDWIEFDYQKAFDKLLEVDKTGKWICLSGKHWKWFDHKKAFKKLLEVDTTGEWIIKAGRRTSWKYFDYSRALNKIVEIAENNPTEVKKSAIIIANYWKLSENEIKIYISLIERLFEREEEEIAKAIMGVIGSGNLDKNIVEGLTNKLIKIGAKDIPWFIQKIITLYGIKVTANGNAETIIEIIDQLI